MTGGRLSQRHRWPVVGALLSVGVPGAGRIRSGHTRRGLRWALVWALGGVFSYGLAAASWAPVWLWFLLLAVMLAAYLIMLKDCAKPGRMTFRGWFTVLAMWLAMVAVHEVCKRWVARPFKMPTSAMSPTLQGKTASNPTGDHVFVSRLAYLVGKPERGDLVVFGTRQIPEIVRRNQEEVFYVKRLVGLPGEEITIENGRVYADGKLLTEADGIPPIDYTLAPQGPAKYRVGENHYFALGDNSPNSWDSRAWGNVPAEDVIGKVTKIYYPFSRAGTPRYESSSSDDTLSGQ